MNSMFNFPCRHTGHSPLTREFPVLHIEPVTASLIACCSVSLFRVDYVEAARYRSVISFLPFLNIKDVSVQTGIRTKAAENVE